jgi:hypothetical protein
MKVGSGLLSDPCDQNLGDLEEQGCRDEALRALLGLNYQVSLPGHYHQHAY